ncbi:MAG: L-lactate dehydrogenase complex protein LldG [Thermoleophilaceae bacterium]|nr:L-lactate dehydrogenase complex protein LldG [Thermoleophilaceae bacterium]
MSSARDAVLGRVREALRDAPPPPAVERRYDRTREVADVVALFAERVSEYRANVRRTTDPAAAIERALAEHGARRVVVAPGLPWRPGGVELIEDDGLGAHELDALDGVVTGCEVAIAETGTIALTAAQGRRAITLVPDLHVCVVEAERIVATVPEAIERLGPPSGPVTLVSGPSATSDIELSRVEGVHGPRRLEVIVSER